MVSACFAFWGLAVGGWAAVGGAWAMQALFWAVSQPAGVGRATWWIVGVASAWSYAFALWGLASTPLWALGRVFGFGGWLWPAALWSGWQVAWTLLQRRRVRIHRLPGLPFRVVQLSDIHVTGLMNRRELAELVARTNALQPELVLLTGDHLTPFSERAPEPFFEALRALRAPAFGCLGNHDLPVRDAVIAGSAAAGVPMLVDESRVHREVEVAGLDFRWTGLAEHVAGFLAAAPPPARFRILLAHDPRVGRHLPEGRFDLVLSGHTHGGHVGLVGERFSWTVVRNLFRIPDHGPWARAGNRMYVSRAIGHYGFQVRLGVPAEESVLEVIPA